METQYQLPNDFRAAVVNALTQFRQEWADTAGEESLIDVEASVGLFLSDIVNLLSLSPTEREAVLGAELACQVEEHLSTSIHLIG
jgi:hypothetical protein